MPLSQSRIGRIIFLGIAIGILVVFAAAAFASVAHAQDRSDPLPSPLFQVITDLEIWTKGVRSVPVVNITIPIRDEVRQVASILSRLADAKEMDSLDGDDIVKRGFWLLQADAAGQRLARSLADALEAPQATVSRQHLQKLAATSAFLQGVLGLLRSQHSYTRVQIREVPKVVEIPAQCPACPRCPDLRCPEASPCPQGPSEAELDMQRRRVRLSACADALRGSVRGWATDLERLGRAAPQYDVSGGVSRLASSLSECVNRYNGSVECEDSLGIRVASWHAQLEEIIRSDDRASAKSSQIIRSQLNSIETDLSVRLRACDGRERRW